MQANVGFSSRSGADGEGSSHTGVWSPWIQDPTEFPKFYYTSDPNSIIDRYHKKNDIFYLILWQLVRWATEQLRF